MKKPLIISSCPIEPYEWTERMTEQLEEAIEKVNRRKSTLEDTVLKNFELWPKALGGFTPRDYYEYGLMCDCREVSSTYKEYQKLIIDYRKSQEVE